MSIYPSLYTVFAKSPVLNSLIDDGQTIEEYISCIVDTHVKNNMDIQRIENIWLKITKNQFGCLNFDEIIYATNLLHKYNVTSYYWKILHHITDRILSLKFCINTNAVTNTNTNYDTNMRDNNLCIDIISDILSLDETKRGILCYLMGFPSVLWINDFVFSYELVDYCYLNK